MRLRGHYSGLYDRQRSRWKVSTQAQFWRMRDILPDITYVLFVIEVIGRLGRMRSSK